MLMDGRAFVSDSIILLQGGGTGEGGKPETQPHSRRRKRRPKRPKADALKHYERLLEDSSSDCSTAGGDPGIAVPHDPNEGIGTPGGSLPRCTRYWRG